MTATARKKPAAKRPEPPAPEPAAIDPAEAWPIPRAAGERPLLFSHAQLRHARSAWGLADFDLLMRRPDDGPDADELKDTPEWQPVPALKYLKYRASEWREAGPGLPLPEPHRADAATLDDAFGLTGAERAGSERADAEAV